MPSLRIPTPLRSYTNGHSEVSVSGGTAGEVIQDLISQFPALRPHLLNGNNELRPFVNLFINQENIKNLEGLATPLREEDRLMLIPSIAGGRSATMLPELSHDEIFRYSRHLLIPEVGLEGQRKLKAASVLVIGTGGLGSPVAMYLAAAGVGRIGLVDYDVVDWSNLQRQILHGSSTLGERKVISARARVLDINSEIRVDVYDEPFTSENAMRIAEPYEILVDGTDNFPTRYLVNDLAVDRHAQRLRLALPLRGG